jgi:hypothetical protein
MKGILLVMLLMLVAGCGGGGGGDQAAPQQNDWKGPLNAAGYPEVQGVYSIVTGERSYTCGTDPVVRKLPGVSMSLQVEQSEDQLLAFNQETVADLTITVIDFTDLAGSIVTSGLFNLAQTVNYTVAGYEGTFTVDNELDGQFTVVGWSGDYRYTVANDHTKITCKYISQFSGERLAEVPNATVQALISLPSTETTSVPAWELLGF